MTGGLVLLLLIAIYRSPIFWLIPFFTVILTEGATRGLAALLGEAGPSSTARTRIPSVLVFGVAMDYAPLLVARYREELTRSRTRARRWPWPGEEPPRRSCLRRHRHRGPADAGLRRRGLLRLDRPVGRRRRRGRAVPEPHAPAPTLALSRWRASWPDIPRFRDDLAAKHKVLPPLRGAISCRLRRPGLAPRLCLVVLALGLMGPSTRLRRRRSSSEGNRRP